MPTDSAWGLAILCAATSMAAVAQGAYTLTTDSKCDCYKTNATAANYFSHHEFFDFRSLHRYVNVTEPIDDFDGNAEAPPTSPYFLRPEFTETWDIQNWDNGALMKENEDVNDATIRMVNSPNNIYIEHDKQNSQTTHLTLRTVRHAKFQSAAEIESLSKGFQFLSVRMRARTTGAHGAVTAMFTYRDPPRVDDIESVQEADLEILTRDPPTRVQYTNQPAWNETSDIPEATRNVTLPGGLRWTDWADYRMDWTPGASTWYVDGREVARIKFQAPRDPLQVIFNAWSDGGSWSGRMPVGSEAFLQIRWVEMVYNSTDPDKKASAKAKLSASDGGCSKVCSIDETSELGRPVLLEGAANTLVAAASACMWLPVLAAGLLLAL
ncbi:glycoside hydrolase family 16 protein [Corynascus similis CBS 632.67]